MRLDPVLPYDIARLQALPVPELFETDAEVLKAKYVTWFEAAAGRKLYPMQIEMLLIETLCYAMSLLGLEAQYTVKQHLVVLASGQHQDILGPNRSTPRLAASKAVTWLRFSISVPLTSNQIIPQGTRVAAAGGANNANAAQVVFVTTAPVQIFAGDLFVDVIAEASLAGAAANGFSLGSITSILDIVPNVSVSNLDITNGGADIESDEAYRLRLANAFERISRAGPREAYRERIMEVSPAIIDCGVVRPQPCYIDLYLLTASGPANSALKAQVFAAMDEETMRPLGDEVTMKDPVSVTLTPEILVRTTTGASTIEAAVRTKAEAILAEWASRLGAELIPLTLENACREVAGVIDANVNRATFEYQKLPESHYLLWNPPVIQMVLV